jgi:hypothetical protein
MVYHSKHFWTNSVSYRDNNGSTNDFVNFNNFDVNRNFTDASLRSNIGTASGNSIEFASNFIKTLMTKVIN